MRQVFRILGDAQLALGDTAAARAAYVEATAAGWEPALMQRAIPVLLTSGDTTRALVLAARVAVDPGTPSKLADSLTRRALIVLGESRWQTMLVDARRRMREHFLGDATRIKLPLDIALVDSANRPTTLERVTRGRVSVVTFWSRECGFSVDQLPRLAQLSARLRERGMALVPIATEAQTPEVAAFLRNHPIGTANWFDASARARRAFGQWSTPEYYVLDEHGVVRFRHSTLELVLAQAVALADAGGE